METVTFVLPDSCVIVLMQVTVYTVVTDGDAITVAPEVVFKPVAGDHSNKTGSGVAGENDAVIEIEPPEHIELFMGVVVTSNWAVHNFTRHVKKVRNKNFCISKN